MKRPFKFTLQVGIQSYWPQTPDSLNVAGVLDPSTGKMIGVIGSDSPGQALAFDYDIVDELIGVIDDECRRRFDNCVPKETRQQIARVIIEQIFPSSEAASA